VERGKRKKEGKKGERGKEHSGFLSSMFTCKKGKGGKKGPGKESEKKGEREKGGGEVFDIYQY